VPSQRAAVLHLCNESAKWLRNRAGSDADHGYSDAALISRPTPRDSVG
jgi:hypothetical protein